MQQSARLLQHIDTSEHTALRLLEELVNINSHSRNCAGVNQVQDRVDSFMRALGLATERIEVSERGNCLRARTAAAGKPVLLLGHADTVHPPESSFQRFCRDGDILRGPGTLDMKGGLIVMLWALHALNTEGLLKRLPVQIFINSAEEDSNQHSVALVQAQAQLSRAALVFEWGRANDGVILRRKGVTSFCLRSAGKAAHSGNAHERGVNALVDLSSAVGELSALTDYSRGITVNVGTLSGGSAVNTVPDSAELKFEFRVENTADYREMTDRVRRIAQNPAVPGAVRTLIQLSSMPPMVETNESRQLYESFAAFAAQAGLGNSTHPGIVGGGSDANYTSGLGCPSIDGLGPFGEGAHTQDEYCLYSSLKKKTAHLALWLKSLTN